MLASLFARAALSPEGPVNTLGDIGLLGDFGQLERVWQGPASVGALLFAVYASWIAVRDWSWRPHYVLLAALSVPALMTTDIGRFPGSQAACHIASS